MSEVSSAPLRRTVLATWAAATAANLLPGAAIAAKNVRERTAVCTLNAAREAELMLYVRAVA